MAWLSQSEVRFARAVSRLTYCNPFLPERIEFEREALGGQFVEQPADWNVHPELIGESPNVESILDRVGGLLEARAGDLERGARPTGEQAALFEDLLLFSLFHRYHQDFDRVIRGATAAGRVVAGQLGRTYGRFAADVAHYLGRPGLGELADADVAHFFAGLYQVRRAFHHIFLNIVGVSKPAALFRAAVWQSIFTHDLRRYRRLLYTRMADFTSLITGPSGTGKELAARAIGLSRYVPFDPARRAFVQDVPASFHAVNLSALSPTLIESELFGHRRGAFTGAVGDRTGWLEDCPALGTVFLDEIGDLEPAIQLKLLRVLETRTFQRIGETKERHFAGKVIAATNRDLADQRRRGDFRDDLYYRLCADMITAPSLRERVADSPDELRHLVLFLSRRAIGDEGEELAEDVLRYVDEHLGADYPWPGNVRELDQCVRNVLIRREYRPAVHAGATDVGVELAQDVTDGALTFEELLGRYCALVYRQCGSYSETARRLGLDRRTVKSRVDRELLRATENV